MATDSKIEEASALPEPPINIQLRPTHDILVINEVELEALYASLRDRYGDPLEIIPSGIDADALCPLKITRDSLKHVFGMTPKMMKRKFGDIGVNSNSYSGFHYFDLDLIRKSVDDFALRNMDAHVADGYIVVNQTHLPEYKTYFLPTLSREEVVGRVIQALQNIHAVDLDHAKNWVISGTSFDDDIHIQIVADKCTGRVITFFPLSTELSLHKKGMHSPQMTSMKNSIFNPCYRETPIMETDAAALKAGFADGIQADWRFVEMDITSKEYVWYKHQIGSPHKPFMQFCLLTQTIIDALLDEMPSREIRVIERFNKICLPIETVQQTLINGFYLRFPEHRSQRDVITKLKQKYT
jgi:hypothetical protein